MWGRLESALAHAGATVFVAQEAPETVLLREKYFAQLNELVVIDIRLAANVDAIRYLEEVANLPYMMTFGT